MAPNHRPLAVVTGASTGIGYELAKCCAQDGFDLVVVADEPEIKSAAGDFRALGAKVDAVQANPPAKASTSFMTRSIAGRSTLSSRMPGGGWAKAFLTRILKT
jgi:short-subunit dehydrogenase